MICYQCEKDTDFINPDSRCDECTNLKTYNEWRLEGHQVNSGARSRGYNREGVSVFSPDDLVRWGDRSVGIPNFGSVA